MCFDYSIKKHILQFAQPAGTSRGVYTERKIWLIEFVPKHDQGVTGIGECAPLPQLSCDALPDDTYLEFLHGFVEDCAKTGRIEYDALRAYPSMLFGIESALLHAKRGSLKFFDTAFSRGLEGITINGLVWMGSFEEMRHRIDEKLKAGFKCIKIKIGAINFEDELSLLRKIREKYPADVVTIRVDANGAFSAQEAMPKLEKLAAFGIHSIEQPIRARQWKEMSELCRNTPIPIALDEELIGINHWNRKEELLDAIKPQFLVLKPSLHGGMSGCDEWIALAKQKQMGFWITSALESNVGLNAIAQWTASVLPSPIIVPQGLGTGQLFLNNFTSPLTIHGDKLYFRE